MDQQRKGLLRASGNDSPTEFILARYIAPETEITKHIEWVEQHLGVRLYPSIPQQEREKPGIVRVYLRIPFPVREEDEGKGGD